MVAEKNGTIRFYDLITQQAILSLECEQVPLMSADWCLKNAIKIGAVAGSDWLIWDITRSRYFYMQYRCLYSPLKPSFFFFLLFFGNRALKCTVYYINKQINIQQKLVNQYTSFPSFLFFISIFC